MYWTDQRLRDGMRVILLLLSRTCCLVLPAREHLRYAQAQTMLSLLRCLVVSNDARNQVCVRQRLLPLQPRARDNERMLMRPPPDGWGDIPWGGFRTSCTYPLLTQRSSSCLVIKIRLTNPQPGEISHQAQAFVSLTGSWKENRCLEDATNCPDQSDPFQRQQNTRRLW